jgi:hypothetical protein
MMSPQHQHARCPIASRFLSRLLLAVVAIALLAAPQLVQAQLAGKGEIKGTVTDSTGAVVSNAVVVATSTTRGTKLSAKTGSAGEYILSPLDADIYTITVTAPGFQTVTQQDLHVNALEVTDVPVALPVGSSSESVTVSSAPPAIEGSNATLGGTLEQETYSQLPIQMGAYGQDGARRATDFVALIPGVQFNESNGNATTNTGVVNGGGARGAVSDVYINGTPFISAAGQGDPRFVWSAISVDAINQLQVQTVGYSAIYEGQGVQNYTVKSGTNSFHGAAYEYFRNTALDTFGYFDKATAAIDPLKGKLIKPAEHQNEFGGAIGGPVLRNKAFFFANFNKYRLSRGPKHAFETIPTLAEQSGDFSGITQVSGSATVPVYIYDPASCPNGNTGNCQRTQFPGNKIPASRFSGPSAAMQKFLAPYAPSNTQQVNNYLGGYNSGLSNYTGTGRLDYTISQKHTVSFVVGIGSQQTTGPARQTTISATSNQLPAPFITVQQFNPKTKVGMIEETWVVSPRAVNQFKYGFARYEGSGFNQSFLPQYSATTLGISGLPSGQAAGSFPKVTFTGTAAPNQWAGYTDNHQATNAFTLVDNFSMSLGKHSLTAGVQLSWLQYNYQAQSAGSTPLTIAFTAAQTGCYNSASTVNTTTGVPNCATGTIPANINTLTGLPYASFLLGAVNSASFTTTTVIETGARFRPISPYIQDDWKITPKLTVNIGLRWDYYPPFREVKNRLSFLDTNATNSITGTKGALAFAGSGAAPYCNCSTNVQTWMKNFGPRLGFAYSLTPRTVIRSSYGVIFAHGNGTGGSAISRQGSGQLGYAASPSYSSSGASLPAFYLQNGVPSYTVPPFFTSTYGTGYYTGGSTPQTVTFGDPYYGDRAPEFLNWSFGLQQAFTNNMTLTASYVGSQGHFLQPDSNNARGRFINQLEPKYLALGSTVLGQKATPANLAAAGLTAPYANFDQNQTIAKALAPFAQYNSISDAYGAVANSNYHAVQTSLMQRFSSGMSFMINYTWAKNIDDGGTFRSGYAIPAFATTTGQAYRANRIDRALSLADRRHNLVATGVFTSPFGTSIFANSLWTRRLAGGYRLSTIFTAYTGSPLAITSATANTNPSQSQASPSYNPNYAGNGRKNGKWGDNITADTASLVSSSYLDNNAFIATPDYKFSVLPRTAPYGLIGPGNYNLDLSLRRTFSMPHAEFLRLTLEGDLYNALNHTQFGGINTSYGNAAFGTVTQQANQSRDAQLSARIEF